MSPKKRKKKFRSRLEKVESERMTRQAIVVIIVTIVLVALLIVFGIPALINVALFLGEINSTGTPIEQTDTIPPPAPQVATPPQATNSAQLNLTGYTETGATVKLYHNGNQIAETTTNDQGEFQFLNLTLSQGENRLYAQAIDTAGNQSSRSVTHTVTVDQKPPELEVIQPEDGQEFIGLNERLISIQGTTEPEVSVKINERFAVVDSQGDFNSRQQLEEGDNTITITATDEAGNTTTEDLTVRYRP